MPSSVPIFLPFQTSLGFLFILHGKNIHTRKNFIPIITILVPWQRTMQKLSEKLNWTYVPSLGTRFTFITFHCKKKGFLVTYILIFTKRYIYIFFLSAFEWKGRFTFLIFKAKHNFIIRMLVKFLFLNTRLPPPPTPLVFI